MTGQTVILHGDKARAVARRLIDLAPPGAVVNVREATRTHEQNKKMQAMLSDVARFKPDGRVLDTEKWKCLFMDALGKKADWEPGLDGEGVVNVGYRSSRLTKSDMSDLIAFIDAWGTQKGVVWTYPESGGKS